MLGSLFFKIFFAKNRLKISFTPISYSSFHVYFPPVPVFLASSYRHREVPRCLQSLYQAVLSIGGSFMSSLSTHLTLAKKANTCISSSYLYVSCYLLLGLVEMVANESILCKLGFTGF